MLLVLCQNLRVLCLTALPLLTAFEVRFSHKCASSSYHTFMPSSANGSLSCSLGLLLLEEHLLAHPIHHKFEMFQCEAVLEHLLLLQIIFDLWHQLVTTFLSPVFLCDCCACRIGDLQGKGLLLLLECLNRLVELL